MADPEQATDTRLVFRPHCDEQLVRFLLVLLRQLHARLLCFRHRVERGSQAFLLLLKSRLALFDCEFLKSSKSG